METFTLCDRMVVHVFRGPTGGAAAHVIGAGIDPTLGSASVAFPSSVALDATDGSSWLMADACHRSATDLAQSLATLTLRDSLAAPGAVATWDSAGGRTSNWSAVTLTVNASHNWRTWITEIKGYGLHVSTSIHVGNEVPGDGTLTFAWPPGTQEGDFAYVVGWCWSTGGSIPVSDGTWSAGGSISGANMGIAPYSKVVPAGAIVDIPEIAHLVP